jgi:hypothetical protein
MGKALRGVLGAVLIVALFGGTPVSSAEPDFDTPTGHYYSQTSGMAGYGFTLENSGGVDFWDEFRRLGGVSALGYSVSQRFTYKNYLSQAY